MFVNPNYSVVVFWILIMTHLMTLMTFFNCRKGCLLACRMQEESTDCQNDYQTTWISFHRSYKDRNWQFQSEHNQFHNAQACDSNVESNVKLQWNLLCHVVSLWEFISVHKDLMSHNSIIFYIIQCSWYIINGLIEYGFCCWWWNQRICFPR